MWKRLLIIGLVLWGAHNWWRSRAVLHGPGVIAAAAPLQHDIKGASTFDLYGYRITPLADFMVEARVLSRENYHIGREADLSETDFALGWGRMSDESVLKNIEISQSNRFFFWHVQELPIPERELEISAANMHLIPSDKNIAREIDNVRPGQVVHLEGYLVRVNASDGWHWVSSLTREDTGAGACEVFYVQQLRVVL